MADYVAKSVGVCALSKVRDDFSTRVAKVDVPFAEWCLCLDAISGCYPFYDTVAEWFFESQRL